MDPPIAPAPQPSQPQQLIQGDDFCARIAHFTSSRLQEGLQAIESDLADIQSKKDPGTRARATANVESQLILYAERVKVLRQVHEGARFSELRSSFSEKHGRRLDSLSNILEQARRHSSLRSLRRIHRKTVSLLRKIEKTSHEHHLARPQIGVPSLLAPESETARFTFLLFSDLHWDDNSRLPDWQEAETELFNSVRAVQQRCGKFDLVLFAGDLVRSGTEPQFRSLDDFFERLWRHLPGDPPLLTVPGNHDLFRAASIDAATRKVLDLLTAYPKNSQLPVSILGEPQPPPPPTGQPRLSELHQLADPQPGVSVR